MSPRSPANCPNYVSVARLDPDGRGMRFALTQAYKANLIEAGDKAFIDLLPQSWTGRHARIRRPRRSPP